MMTFPCFVVFENQIESICTFVIYWAKDFFVIKISSSLFIASSKTLLTDLWPSYRRRSELAPPPISGILSAFVNILPTPEKCSTPGKCTHICILWIQWIMCEGVHPSIFQIHWLLRSGWQMWLKAVLRATRLERAFVNQHSSILFVHNNSHEKFN